VALPAPSVSREVALPACSPCWRWSRSRGKDLFTAVAVGGACSRSLRNTWPYCDRRSWRDKSECKGRSDRASLRRVARVQQLLGVVDITIARSPGRNIGVCVSSAYSYLAARAA
jgi:hypothetical protein